MICTLHVILACRPQCVFMYIHVHVRRVYNVHVIVSSHGEIQENRKLAAWTSILITYVYIHMCMLTCTCMRCLYFDLG